MNRRAALKALLAGGGSLPLAGACRRMNPRNNMNRGSASEQPSAAAGETMPAIFLAHGSPLLLDATAWGAELERWARALPRPRSVLMVSAHWEQRPVTVGATRTVPLVYDFSGFPARYYQVKYPAPGAPELAQRIRAPSSFSRMTCGFAAYEVGPPWAFAVMPLSAVSAASAVARSPFFTALTPTM